MTDETIYCNDCANGELLTKSGDTTTIVCQVTKVLMWGEEEREKCPHDHYKPKTGDDIVQPVQSSDIVQEGPCRLCHYLVPAKDAKGWEGKDWCRNINAKNMVYYMKDLDEVHTEGCFKPRNDIKPDGDYIVPSAHTKNKNCIDTHGFIGQCKFQPSCVCLHHDVAVCPEKCEFLPRKAKAPKPEPDVVIVAQPVDAGDAVEMLQQYPDIVLEMFEQESIDRESIKKLIRPIASAGSGSQAPTCRNCKWSEPYVTRFCPPSEGCVRCNNPKGRIARPGFGKTVGAAEIDLKEYKCYAPKEEPVSVGPVLTLGSLFDGIGGFPLAASRCNIKLLWASEKDKQCNKVTAHHFPDIEQLGDITKLDGRKLKPVNIITAGFPCQDFSVAGKREGLKGERSSLFYDAMRIIREMKDETKGQYPKICLLENVPGLLSNNKGEDFRKIINEIVGAEIPLPKGGKWTNAGVVEWKTGSLAWGVKDAQYFGVPQRRRRVFIILDIGGHRAGEILFEHQSVSGHPAQGGEAGLEVARPLVSSPHRKDCADREQYVVAGFNAKNSASMGGVEYIEGLSPTVNPSRSASVVGTDVARCQTAGEGERLDGESCNFIISPTLRSNYRNNSNPITEALMLVMGVSENQRHEVILSEKMHSLSCAGGKPGRGYPAICVDARNGRESDLNGSLQAGVHGQAPNNNQVVRQGMGVRRLTPLEAERLMGFPDGWTEGHSDTARYKMLGNSVAVPVVEWIMRRIVDALGMPEKKRIRKQKKKTKDPAEEAEYTWPREWLGDPCIREKESEGVVFKIRPASDCLLCNRHKLGKVTSEGLGHLCDGVLLKHNIYTEVCPTPEKRGIKIPANYLKAVKPSKPKKVEAAPGVKPVSPVVKRDRPVNREKPHKAVKYGECCQSVVKLPTGQRTLSEYPTEA